MTDRPSRHELIDLLDGLPADPWAGPAWRHSFGGYSPLRTNVTGARWNPPDVEAFYCSLAREVAAAEGDHAVAIQPLRPRAPRFLSKMEIRLASTYDLTDPAVLQSLGVDEEERDSDDHAACRAVGEAANWLGRDGILVPSARTLGVNLVIFIANLSPEALLELLSTEPYAGATE